MWNSDAELSDICGTDNRAANRLRSFTKAASVLSIAQSALSHQVRLLETEFRLCSIENGRGALRQWLLGTTKSRQGRDRRLHTGISWSGFLNPRPRLGRRPLVRN